MIGDGNRSMVSIYYVEEDIFEVFLQNEELGVFNESGDSKFLVIVNDEVGRDDQCINIY